MNKLIRSLLLIGIGCLAAGMIYWTIPYRQLEMISLFLPWSAPAILVGAFGVALLNKSPLDSSLKTTTGFVAAVFGRVVYEATVAPSTHSLWPFELVLTILIAFPLSLIGSYLCKLILTVIRGKK